MKAAAAIVLLLAALSVGCDKTLKHSLADDRCNEIHVKAPPQKVIVNIPRDEVCERPPEKKEQPSPPAQVQGQPEPSTRPMMYPQAAPMAAPAAAPMAAPMNYAAVPSIPGGLGIGLTFDWIRISIPIPRLRSIELPPESSMSFVSMGGAAVAAPVAPMMAPPPMPAAAEQACYTPEQIAAAMAYVRRQQGGGQAAGTANTSSMDAELAKRERELEEKAKRLDDAAKKLDGLINQAGGSGRSSADNDNWRQSARPLSN